MLPAEYTRARARNMGKDKDTINTTCNVEHIPSHFIQGVHEVSLQFQKFITMANEEAGKWKLLQSET